MKGFIPARGIVCALVAIGLVSLLVAQPASAGVNFTSGKVYVQQKVYDKAAHYLELARKEEPDNTQVYSLLGFSRSQLRQFASAGGAFQIGIKVCTDKKDKKRADEIEQNRKALYADLFNQGIKALGRAGKIAQDDARTTDEGTPQAAVAKERGEPRDFSRFTENGKMQEFWYYPDQSTVYYFPQGADPIQIPYKPFSVSADPSVAVTDTTVFPAYTGGSAVAEASYDFGLAMLIDPSSPDTYKNLSYTYDLLGRPDDAIKAAQRGLELKPGDEQLTRNLRVAAMGRGNRLYGSGRFMEAIPAYRAAMAYDAAGTVQYLSLIAECYQKGAPSEGPTRAALLDSASAAYMEVYNKAPNDSTGASLKENAIYNSAIIQLNLENTKKGLDILNQGVAAFPNNKDLLTLQGQTKFQAGDMPGAVEAMQKVVTIDPKSADAHQVLFSAYNKLKQQDKSVAEYTIYKALSDGKQRTGSQLKVWVDSAPNRLGAKEQLTKTKTTEGYPEEVRTFMDGDKNLESWFYWSKGKSITFFEGQLFSQATFPPAH
ncbi:MAG TPA: tetratricopeptide repeat protein [Candidatus Eisenbacteria bacterium]|nr:tetratricopeptide repeat protein [Candidatus Eisenbacteria bacterium]